MPLEFPEPDYMSDPELRMFRDAVGTFLSRAVDEARIAKWRADGQVERAFWREAGAAGLLGVSVPTSHGGGGGDFRHDLVVVDQVQRRGIEGFAASLHNVIITPYIQLHGTDEQKARWLPRLASGDRVAAIAMSEPGAGSDLQAIRTSAVRDGDAYRITGSKTFISNGQIADLIVVVAKTDAGAGARGISLFVVEPDEVDGFRRGARLDKIGNDAQDTSELFFDDVRVPADNLLGGVEGQGFRQLMAELPRERLLIAINSVASMERAIELTIAYTRERRAFGQPVFDFQNTQFVLADCYARARAADALVNDCINRALAGTLDGATSAAAKLFASESEGKVVDACLQLHGGYGYINDYPIARLYRNARVSRIYGGSSEIMRLLIARAM